MVSRQSEKGPYDESYHELGITLFVVDVGL